MARPVRKFKVDSSTGKVVEITTPEVVVACEEIEAGTNPFKRDLFADDSLPGKSTRRIAKWPIVSTSAGIDPDDVPIQQDVLAQHGVKTEYTSHGEPIFRDRSHRRDHCKALGIVDYAGGYGDYTG